MRKLKTAFIYCRKSATAAFFLALRFTIINLCDLIFISWLVFRVTIIVNKNRPENQRVKPDLAY